MQDCNRATLSDHELEIITNTLLVCESVIFHIGIPLLPNSEKRIALKSTYFSPLEDFIKASLATITTPKLKEAYYLLCKQDLASEDYKKLSKKLAPTSYLDLIYFPVLITLIIFTLVVSIKIPYEGITSKSIISALMSSCGALVGSSFTTTNTYRFYSFREILKDELDRRDGKIKNLPTNNIPIQTLNRKSLNDQIQCYTTQKEL